jgi:hypothetical protein
MPLVRSGRVLVAAVLLAAAHDHATILDQAETAPAQLIAGVATSVDARGARPIAGRMPLATHKAFTSCLLPRLQAPQVTHVLTLQLKGGAPFGGECQGTSVAQGLIGGSSRPLGVAVRAAGPRERWKRATCGSHGCPGRPSFTEAFSRGCLHAVGGGS